MPLILLLTIFTAQITLAETNTFDLPTLSASQQPVDFEADQMVYEQDRLTLTGDAKLTQPPYTVTTDHLDYNTKCRVLRLPTHATLKSKTGEIFHTQALCHNFDTQTTHITQLKGTLQKGQTISATKAQVTNQQRQAKEVFYTPCRFCQPKNPLWAIKAKQVTHDTTKNTLHYYQPEFHINGKKAARLPSFTQYLPSSEYPKESVTGLLTPRLKWYNKSLMVRAPFVVNLGPSQDLLLAPLVSTRKETTLQAIYRRKVTKGDITLNIHGGRYVDDTPLNDRQTYLWSGFVKSRAHLQDHAQETPFEIDIAINRTFHKTYQQRFDNADNTGDWDVYDSHISSYHITPSGHEWTADIRSLQGLRDTDPDLFTTAPHGTWRYSQALPSYGWLTTSLSSTALYEETHSTNYALQGQTQWDHYTNLINDWRLSYRGILRAQHGRTQDSQSANIQHGLPHNRTEKFVHPLGSLVLEKQQGAFTPTLALSVAPHKSQTAIHNRLFNSPLATQNAHEVLGLPLSHHHGNLRSGLHAGYGFHYDTPLSDNMFGLSLAQRWFRDHHQDSLYQGALFLDTQYLTPDITYFYESAYSLHNNKPIKNLLGLKGNHTRYDWSINYSHHQDPDNTYTAISHLSGEVGLTFRKHWRVAPRVTMDFAFQKPLENIGLNLSFKNECLDSFLDISYAFQTPLDDKGGWRMRAGIDLLGW
jgi:lipopolysaccharide assembly outer membrane protein LptD (OstA)